MFRSVWKWAAALIKQEPGKFDSLDDGQQKQIFERANITLEILFLFVFTKALVRS